MKTKFNFVLKLIFIFKIIFKKLEQLKRIDLKKY